MFCNQDQEDFRRAERVLGNVKDAKAYRGKYGRAHMFINKISKTGHDQPAFTNIGRWRHNEADVRVAPVYVPWLTIDIDNVNLVEAYKDAVRTVEELIDLGYDPERIVCSFSGNKGYHIQIDSTQLGLCPFVGPHAAQLFLQEFSKSVCTGDYWDPAVTSVRSLIRVTGSTHATSGLHKRSFLGDTFIAGGIDRVMRHVRREYRAFEWPEGGNILPGPRSHLREVYERSESRYRGERSDGNRGGSKTGVLSRIKHGVEQGQEFGPKNFHVGRENAAFLVGCAVIDEYGTTGRRAYEKLKVWNGYNDPPLPMSRLDAQWRGAKRKMSSNNRRR